MKGDATCSAPAAAPAFRSPRRVTALECTILGMSFLPFGRLLARGPLALLVRRRGEVRPQAGFSQHRRPASEGQSAEALARSSRAKRQRTAELEIPPAETEGNSNGYIELAENLARGGFRRIVRWVDVIDLERAVAMDLNDRGTARPGIVIHVRGHGDKAARLERLPVFFVELVA